MKRSLIILILIWAVEMVSSAQIRIIPADSLEQASRMHTQWCAEYLKFDSLSIDAGTFPEDSAPIEAEYRLENRGKQSIFISRVESSCSCLEAEISGKLIRKGQYATIRVKYHPKGHPGIHPRYIWVYEQRDGEEKLASTLIFLTKIL